MSADTPELERFLERHKLVLDITLMNGRYVVSLKGAEITSFDTLAEAEAMVAREQAENEEGVREMYEREGDLSEDSDEYDRLRKTKRAEGGK